MNKKYLGRYRTIACMVAVLFGVLITRLFNLQVAGYEDNLDSAESKKTKTITQPGISRNNYGREFADIGI